MVAAKRQKRQTDGQLNQRQELPIIIQLLGPLIAGSEPAQSDISKIFRVTIAGVDTLLLISNAAGSRDNVQSPRESLPNRPTSRDQDAGPIANAFDVLDAMRNENDSLAQCLKRFVSHGENFIDDKKIGIEINRQREAEARVHAGGIIFDRGIHEVLQLRELDNGRIQHLDFLARKSVNRGTSKDLFAAG